MLKGATETIGVGALKVDVAATFPDALYRIPRPVCSWMTGVSVTAKGPTGFTINFAVPCPAGGGICDWIAVE